MKKLLIAMTAAITLTTVAYAQPYFIDEGIKKEMLAQVTAANVVCEHITDVNVSAYGNIEVYHITCMNTGSYTIYDYVPAQLVQMYYLGE